LRLLRLLRDALPLRGQPSQIGCEILCARSLRRGPNDDAVLGWAYLAHCKTKPAPLVLGQATADSEHLGIRNEHQVASGQADLLSQPGALTTDGVLGHLDHQGLAGLDDLLDPRHLPLDLLV